MKVQDRIDLFVKKFGFMPEAYEIVLNGIIALVINVLYIKITLI